MTTTKVWACVSGSRPATTPAATIRACDDGPGNDLKPGFPEEPETRTSAALSFPASQPCFFLSLRFPFGSSSFPVSPRLRVSASAFSSPQVASHHCVNTITASGNPSSIPRWGSNSDEIALPQRQGAVSPCNPRVEATRARCRARASSPRARRSSRTGMASPRAPWRQAARRRSCSS